MPTAPKRSNLTAKQSPDFPSVICRKEDHAKAIYGCCFNPYIDDTCQNHIFATAGADRVSIYECLPKNSHQPVKFLQQYRDSQNDDFFCVSWLYCPDYERHLVAAAGLKGVIRVISPTDGNCVASLIGHGESVNELRTHPEDSVILASVGKDYTVRIWNASRGFCVGIISGCQAHSDQVLSADFDQTGARLATASMDHSIKVWNLNATSKIGKAIALSHTVAKRKFKMATESHPIATTTDLHTNYVDCVRWFGGYLISKSSENLMYVWKFGTLEDINSPQPQSGSKIETNVTLLKKLDLPHMDMWFSKFCVDPDLRFLAASNKFGLVHLWNLSTGMPKGPHYLLREAGSPQFMFRQLEFSPDGKILVGVTDDSAVLRWDRKKMEIVID